jgi:two-component system, NarL family, sensor histidine kinase UhpB
MRTSRGVEKDLDAGLANASASPLLRLLEEVRDVVYWYRVFPGRGMEYIAGAVEALTGHTAEDFYADPDLTLKAVHPADVHRLAADASVRSLAAPVSVRWVHADGRIVVAEHRRMPIYDASGRLIAIAGIARDVTEYIATQEQLRLSQERMRRLATSLQTARERERTALARELHDELGQTLTAVKMELARTTDVLKAASISPAAMDCLQSLVGLVDIGVATVQRIATWLRPPALDYLGLAEAIRSEAAIFRARSGIRCHLTTQVDENGLTSKQRTALFRIFQEALTNVVRHAHASAVRVRLARRSDGFELRVADNGKGITRAQINDARAVGLLGMRERVSQAGGTFRISGTAGKGTTIVARLPMSASRRRTAKATRRSTARHRAVR